MRLVFFFVMIRRPPRSTLDRSSAASDVYKRQPLGSGGSFDGQPGNVALGALRKVDHLALILERDAVSYTHLRAHETVLDLVCRLLLEKKKKNTCDTRVTRSINYHENKNA